MKTLITLLFVLMLNFNAESQTKKFSINNNEFASNNVEIRNGKITFERNSNAAFINWETSNESNTSQFELQYSFDNVDFITIKTVAASDVTSWSTKYQVKSGKTYISNQKVFYRIKTIFNNGLDNYSNSVVFETNSKNNEINYIIIN